MEEPDLYDILQVPSTAGPEDIRRAYRALLRKHHPDMHKPRDAVEARRLARNVAAIHHAYEVLSDPLRRAAYDRWRRRPQAKPVPRGRNIHVRVHRSGDAAGAPGPTRPSGTPRRSGTPESPAETEPAGAEPPERDEVWVVRDDPRQRQDGVWVVPDDVRQRQDEVWVSQAWLRPRQDDAISLCPEESALRPPPDVFERLLWRWFFR
ncbi:J domain-containing protein [Arthrobacter sp. USHLN218]|uniref:J domain-containing protein n=1 Tax=Arthrobacter sp. USHLN218 TaxID=3081232 RepID=UPI003016A025